MNPLVGGALIGLGGSVLGSIFNAGSQSSANKTNVKLAREQRAWNEKMWHLDNLYNTPLAQMQRFAAAGLNPNLIYGQGSSGNASSPAQGVDAPTVRPNWNLDSQIIGQALQLSSNLKVNDSIVEKNIQDAAKAREEARVAGNNADLIAFNLSRSQSLLPYEQEKFDYENSILGFNARKQYDRYGREVLGFEAQNANMWATTAKIKADTEQVNKFISQMDQRLRNDTIRALSSKISANAALLSAKAQRTMADISGGRLELDWTRNSWESHAQSLKNSVTEKDIETAGALYAKLLAEGKGEELKNRLMERYGDVEKVVGIVTSIVDTASGVINSVANFNRSK